MKRVLLLLALLAIAPRAFPDALYPFAVPMPEDRRALLWIPPDCDRLRGLVLSLSNLLEPGFLESPRLRQVCATERLGIVWIVDGSGNKTLNGSFDYKAGHADTLTRALADLARESGYTEIEYAPLLTFGHSAAGPMAWRIAYWQPGRVFGALPVKARVDFPPDFDPQATIAGVPVLYLTGEFVEWSAPSGLTQRASGERDAATALRLRNNPHNLVGTAVEWGAGHFEWSDELDRIAAQFVQRTAQLRIPAALPDYGPVRLLEVPPESGWLADGTNVFPAAGYTGDTARTLWYPDEELARACVGLNADQRGRSPQMVTFTHEGKPLPIGPSGFVSLPFAPTGDVREFAFGATFLDAVPAGLVGEGTKLGHADTTPGVRLCGGGSLREIGPGRFRVAFGPLGLTPKALQVWLLAYAPGDASYRQAVQPGKLTLPKSSNHWKNGRIDFPIIGKIRRDAPPLRLAATADNGVAVDVFVKSGPAVLRDGDLTVTGIPPRAKLPMKVVVVAHQWGRGNAEPVEQTILVE